MLNIAKLDQGPEIFHTIQGEGKNLGVPSVFIRLSLCNLYCVWCDTDYTWNWENTNYNHVNDSKPDYSKFKKDEHILRMTADQILEEVAQYNCKHVVITGGEPLVQHKELIELCAKLKSLRKHIEFETNGTLVPNEDLEPLIDQYNVSVKLSNSFVKKEERISPKAIEFFSQSSKSNFKFVIEEQSDLDEVLHLIEEYQIPHDSVYLMPQGTTPEMLNNKQQWLIEVCKEKGFNYTDRLHIHVYGPKRGV
ncbi:MAG: 7-carboxy-7-deazaguanine synthase QueE [bacterium]|nr:7-carboxy-7-deazaguanine synthase QueE [bacterium]